MEFLIIDLTSFESLLVNIQSHKNKDTIKNLKWQEHNSSFRNVKKFIFFTNVTVGSKNTRSNQVSLIILKYFSERSRKILIFHISSAFHNVKSLKQKKSLVNLDMLLQTACLLFNHVSFTDVAIHF